jgi:uncharacterized protein YggU (UPF0235/DUF167 family)
MRIDIHVRPGSSMTRVGGTYRDALLVKVSESAIDGQATRAVLKAVADSLSLPVRRVTLFGGYRTRNKILEILLEPENEKVIAKRIAELRSLT